MLMDSSSTLLVFEDCEFKLIYDLCHSFYLLEEKREKKRNEEKKTCE